MSAHTPGPWEVFGGRLVRAVQGENAIPIASLEAPYRRGTGIVRSEREQQANARLIAAAPDLLTALEDVLARWHREVSQGDGFPEDGDAQAYAAARAVAAKARSA